MAELPSDNLYITGIPAELDDESVKGLFEQYGSVVGVRCMRREGLPTMNLLCRYATVEESQWVMENVNGNIPEGLLDPVTIRYAESPEMKAAKKGKGDAWGKGCAKGVGKKGGDDLWGAVAAAVQRFSPYEGKGAKGAKGTGKDLWGGADGGKGFAKGGTKGGISALIQGLVDAGALVGSAGSEDATIFVSGLPSDTTDLDLFRIFNAFGPIQAKHGVKAMTAEDGSCKGFGFVNFLDINSAQGAIMALNGTQLQNGTTLTVRIKAEGKGEGKAGGGKGGKAGGKNDATAALLKGLLKGGGGGWW